jgi:hypothetical protein
MINENCFSACRDAAIYLSAFPNVVIVGHEMNIKNASGYFPSVPDHRLNMIQFTIASI